MFKVIQPLCLTLLFSQAQALPPGDFLLKQGQLTPQIQSWGPDCGSRPSKERAPSGRIYQLDAQGHLHGRPALFESGVCKQLTGLPQLQEQLGSQQISCRSQEGSAKQVKGVIRSEHIDLNRIHIHQRLEYHWSLKGSQCRLKMQGRWKLERLKPLPLAPQKPDSGQGRRHRAKPGAQIQADPEWAAIDPQPEVEDEVLPPHQGAGLEGRPQEEQKGEFPWRLIASIFAALLLILGIWFGLKAIWAQRERRASKESARQARRRAQVAAYRAIHPTQHLRVLRRQCPDCERLFDEETHFCPHDGSPLESLSNGPLESPSSGKASKLKQMICPKCGVKYSKETRFCGHDGSGLVPLN